jgi:hypothetical protein
MSSEPDQPIAIGENRPDPFLPLDVGPPVTEPTSVPDEVSNNRHAEIARVTEIAKRVRNGETACRKHVGKAAERAVETGHLLIEAKKILGHGRFGDFVRKQCEISERSAAYYMAIARSGMKSATVAKLGLRGAAAAINREAVIREHPALAAAMGAEMPPEHAKTVSMKKFRSCSIDSGDKPKSARAAPSLHPLERPQDFQALSLTWDDDDSVKHVLYVWRELPVGPYEGSSRAYAYIHARYKDDAGGRMVDVNADRRLRIWADIESLVSSVPEFDESTKHWMTKRLPDGAVQQIWDLDFTTITILGHWRQREMAGPFPRGEDKAARLREAYAARNPPRSA